MISRFNAINALSSRSPRGARSEGAGTPSGQIQNHSRSLTLKKHVEDLLAERGIIVSYEAIRIRCKKFSSDYALDLKQRQGRLGDSWHLDEVYIRINGQQHYLWRAANLAS